MFEDQECLCPQAPLGKKTQKNKHLFSSPLQEEGKLYFLDVIVARIGIVQLKEGIVEMVRENIANGRKTEKLRQRYVGRKKRTGHN